MLLCIQSVVTLTHLCKFMFDNRIDWSEKRNHIKYTHLIQLGVMKIIMKKKTVSETNVCVCVFVW